MPETPETADDIRTIRYKIESIETTQHLLLRGQSRELLEDLRRVFARNANLTEVYLAVDGNRSLAEIVESLRSSKPPVSQPTVYRKIRELEEEGLIEKRGVSPTGGIIWGKKDVVEKVLRLSRALLRQRKESRGSP